MKKNRITLDSIEKTDPFKIPENYFEQFVAGLMSTLPDRPVEVPAPVRLWERVQPWLYMAAMFAGIALMINLFAEKPDRKQGSGQIYVSGGPNLTSSADIEDFYLYYEEESVEIVYDDAMADFLDDGDTESIY